MVLHETTSSDGADLKGLSGSAAPSARRWAATRWWDAPVVSGRRRIDVNRGFGPAFSDQHAREWLLQIDHLAHTQAAQIEAIQSCRELPGQSYKQACLELCNTRAADEARAFFRYFGDSMQ
jgi:hypothetical protein